MYVDFDKYEHFVFVEIVCSQSNCFILWETGFKHSIVERFPHSVNTTGNMFHYMYCKEEALPCDEQPRAYIQLF
jgi:hypothetical protein